MLDVIFVAATLAVFAVVALIARGVENLGPHARSSAPRQAMSGEDRA